MFRSLKLFLDKIFALNITMIDSFTIYTYERLSQI